MTYNDELDSIYTGLFHSGGIIETTSWNGLSTDGGFGGGFGDGCDEICDERFYTCLAGNDATNHTPPKDLFYGTTEWGVDKFL